MKGSHISSPNLPPLRNADLASNIEGAVDRDTVIRVLNACGVSVSQQQNGEPGMLVLSKGDIFEVLRLPNVIRKRLLFRLQAKFSVPVALFYNPHQICDRIQ